MLILWIRVILLFMKQQNYLQTPKLLSLFNNGIQYGNLHSLLIEVTRKRGSCLQTYFSFLLPVCSSTSKELHGAIWLPSGSSQTVWDISKQIYSQKLSIHSLCIRVPKENMHTTYIMEAIRNKHIIFSGFSCNTFFEYLRPNPFR